MGVEVKERQRVKAFEKHVLRGRMFEPIVGSKGSRRKHALRSFIMCTLADY
jgi:hypothetical protein